MAPMNTKRLRAIYVLTQAITGARGRDEILSTFTEKLRDLVPFDTCAVTLVMPDTGDNIMTHAMGEHAASLIGRKITLGEGVTGWTMANLKPFCNTDPKLDFPPAIAEKFSGYLTLACFPIMKDRDLIGAVSLYSATISEYDREQQRLIEEAAAFVATALTAATGDSAAPIRLKVEANPEAPQTARNFNSSPLNLTRAQMESDLTH